MVRSGLIEEVRFASDSPLEEAGFEPSIPYRGKSLLETNFVRPLSSGTIAAPKGEHCAPFHHGTLSDPSSGRSVSPGSCQAESSVESAGFPRLNR